MTERNLTAESRAKMGRPRKGYRQVLWDTYVKPNAPLVLKRMVADALMGEPTLLKFLAERFLPKIPQDEVLDLSGEPQEQIAKLLTYFSTGEVSSDDALKVTNIIEKSVVLTTLKEMAERMARIEEWQKDKSEGTTLNGKAINESAEEITSE